MAFNVLVVFAYVFVHVLGPNTSAVTLMDVDKIDRCQTTTKHNNVHTVNMLGMYRTYIMMTSSNGNIFCVTGHLCGEFTGPRWIPHTKASDAELSCFLWSASDKPLSKHSRGWWFETLSRSFWRHCNGKAKTTLLVNTHIYMNNNNIWKTISHPWPTCNRTAILLVNGQLIAFHGKVYV